jgi:hypothetical protein
MKQAARSRHPQPRWRCFFTDLPTDLRGANATQAPLPIAVGSDDGGDGKEPEEPPCQCSNAKAGSCTCIGPCSFSELHTCGRNGDPTCDCGNPCTAKPEERDEDGEVTQEAEPCTCVKPEQPCDGQPPPTPCPCPCDKTAPQCQPSNDPEAFAQCKTSTPPESSSSGGGGTNTPPEGSTPCTPAPPTAKIKTIGFKDEIYSQGNLIGPDDDNTKEYKDEGGDDGQWKSNNARNWPLAFKAGRPMSLRARLDVGGLAAGTALTITAESSSGLKVTWNATASDSTLDLPYTQSTESLPSKIQCFGRDDSSPAAFKINWKIKIGSGAESAIATTKHTLYTTLAANSKKPETIYYLGCHSAIGKTTADAALLDAIFAEFQDLTVKVVQPCTATESGNALKYQHDASVTLTDASPEYLIREKKGRCQHWAGLFKACANLYGATPALTTVKPVPSVHQEYNQAWDDTWTGSPRPPQHEAILFVKNWQIDQELLWNPIDIDGVEAQGNSDPQGWFFDHLVVTNNGKIYDPSYGVTATSFDQWETGSRDSIGVIFAGSSVAGDGKWAGHPIVTGVRDTEDNPQ